MQKITEAINQSLQISGRGFDENNERVNRQVESFNQAEGKSDTAYIYNCPECKNKGNVAFNKGGAFYTAPCKCLKIRSIIRNMKNSGLGAVEKNTFENYNAAEPWQKEILKKAETFAADSGGHWFFIGGQVGAGKTHIGKAIAYKLLKRGNIVKYMEWKKDAQKLNAAINDPVYPKLLEEFTAPAVLYIDDFLKASSGSAPTPGEINRAIDIIYQRYNQDATVIISSERTAGEICALDEGTGSRIIERCGGFVVNISRDKSKNYRLHDKS